MNMDFYPNEIINDGMVKLRIEAAGELDKVLAKYPRSFLDEMARQLTAEIEGACGVEGLADSTIELVMSFAPNTYLEHISEAVTYRRLSLMDSVSAPRDFWVKWTRLKGDIEVYSEDSILFELGEDVDQKIREKEYRYLLASGNEKYHNSMGRKKVTEWREVIKRAAKRGEITKIETDFELAPETLELEERIADLLGKRAAERAEPEKAEIPFVHSDESEFEAAMASLRNVVESAAEVESEPEIEFVQEEIVMDETDEIEEEIVEDEPELEIEIVEEEVIEEELVEDPEIEIEIIEEEIPEEELVEDPEIEVEIIEEEIPEEEPVEDPEIAVEIIEEEIDEEEIVEEPEIEIEITVEEPEEIRNSKFEIRNEKEPDAAEEEIEVVEEPAPVREIPTPIADRAADIRAELETKIRLEYEVRAREKAEAEIVSLRHEIEKIRIEAAKDKEELEKALAEAYQEQERLRMEYYRLSDETERAEAQRLADEAQRMAEEAELRMQIESQLRAEAQERERLAEAARMAIEEQHRLEAENARIARQREEEERLEEEKRRREEEERELEALRQAELDRIRREDEEAKARARAAMPEMGDGKYSYTSKSVKFVFRKSVDPNITTRIHEIIKATVEYYGKDRVYLKIRATVPDSQSVILDFLDVPIEEMELLGNIIKILGNSGLGISKAIIE